MTCEMLCLQGKFRVFECIMFGPSKFHYSQMVLSSLCFLYFEFNLVQSLNNMHLLLNFFYINLTSHMTKTKM